MHAARPTYGLEPPYAPHQLELIPRVESFRARKAAIIMFGQRNNVWSTNLVSLKPKLSAAMRGVLRQEAIQIETAFIDFADYACC